MQDLTLNAKCAQPIPERPVEPAPLSDQLCFSMYATSMAITRAFRPLLTEFGITYPQYLVLLVLWEFGPSSVGRIAERLELEPSSVTPLVQRLELSRLVSRRRDREDERIVTVHPTPDGLALRSRAVCLAERLLEYSGFDMPRLLALNEDVKALKDGIRRRIAADEVASRT